jgi:hypothetical protein
VYDRIFFHNACFSHVDLLLFSDSGVKSYGSCQLVDSVVRTKPLCGSVFKKLPSLVAKRCSSPLSGRSGREMFFLCDAALWQMCVFVLATL